ncbi:MAG: NAD(P)/FAD-dependent oxidoreductase, partial [Deltaproteobacteria bacterium]|nr:NAD(P)/FAD-dependent oxidoreductase [Deltaproteobacteria bacterium]
VLISHLLTGEKSLKDLAFHDDQWYREKSIDLRTSAPVTRIDRAGKRVFTEDGAAAPYDRLVISTGSVPLMPPIPGIALDGVVAFRHADDCERIRDRARPGAKAVIIGGGLLGLEAAGALLSMGMKVTVVHLMDRLMERQLDKVSSEMLREDLERLGMRVLLNKKTSAIEGGEKVEWVQFSDGEAVEADLVLVSAGIKPEIGLAKDSGLYCERGIVVSDTMQTFDPAVYALGECVQHRGKTFGLVAPIFDQARVVANQLAGDGRKPFKSMPTSARLKVAGIDLYSAGDTDLRAEDSVEYLDRKARVYRKVLFEGSAIKGIVMYGDSSRGPELFSLLAAGDDVSGRRGALLWDGGKGTSSVAPMADDAIVCGCKGVTRKMIVEAIESKGLFTREEIKRETGASSSCGGCAPQIDRILEETLGAGFQPALTQAFCGCTAYSREDVLRNIREKKLKSVSEVMETLGWEGVGCEKCRPAINYHVSVVWPGDCHDDTTSRLINERMHANIQKDDTFSVVPRMYGGVTTPGDLKRIATVAERHKVPLVKITGGQRIALLGVAREELKSVWKEIGMPSGYAYAKALRTVKTCVGERFCRYGTQDSMGLGVEMEKRFSGLWMPAKVKLGVSGCPRSCAESGIKDIGIIGVAGGWDVYAGGCGGIELKAAEKLVSVKTGFEVIEVVSAFLQHYREDAHYGERTFKWAMRRGLANIRKEAIEDSAARMALCERIEKAIALSEDPWADEGGEERKGA